MERDHDIKSPKVELRPMTWGDRRAIQAQRNGIRTRLSIISTITIGTFVILAMAVFGVIIGLIHLLVDIVVGRSLRTELADAGGLLLAIPVMIPIVYLATGLMITRDEWLAARKRRRIRRTELEQGRIRTTTATADRAWFHAIAPIERMLIFRVGPEQLLVVPNYPPGAGSPPSEIGRHLRLSQLPQSNDLISLEASGDPIPVVILGPKLGLFSHDPVEGLVAISQALADAQDVFRK